MAFTNSRKPNDAREVNLKLPFLTRVYIKKNKHSITECIVYS